jgi:hypothetical protein
MVRNFKSGNSSPFFPIRFCRNTKGPPELAFTTSASTTIMGEAAVQSTRAQQISNNRLLPESGHGAALVSAEANAVGLVLSIIPSRDECLWELPRRVKSKPSNPRSAIGRDGEYSLEMPASPLCCCPVPVAARFRQGQRSRRTTTTMAGSR